MIQKEYHIDIQRDYRGGWVARLSNGETIYQQGQDCTWEHLKQYVDENNLQITSLGVKFMDHEEWLPQGEAYYSANGVLGVYGLPVTIQQCNVGYVQDGILKVKHFRKPEMMEIDYDERDLKLEEFKTLCEYIVWNNRPKQ